jgi:hypothetical protein
MTGSDDIKICKSCGFSGTGNYCNNCGQSFIVKKITLPGLLHDILHFFTHFEKGFGYTLKQLTIAPGHMQRTYLEGKRSIHQKPFSMFFICATIAALTRFWILSFMIQYYHADIISEAKFFHEYMVLTYIALMPVYALMTHLIFYKTKYNFAETGVMMLYTLSFIFLASALISLPKLFYPHLETTFIEFPLFTIYIMITLINYFKTIPWWIVAVKSIVIMVAAFILNDLTEDFMIRLIA